MRALVVYESMFGNTKRIALAIADGIGTRMPAQAIEVADAVEEIPDDVDLLVVGGPTHVHGMSSTKTRATAAERTSQPLVSQRFGIREWLDRAHPALYEVPAAAFDTRVGGPVILTGSAAKGFTRGLRSAGFRVVEPPHSFIVGSRTPPEDDALLDGELDRARAWGETLVARMPARV
jgi:hypothetical protein